MKRYELKNWKLTDGKINQLDVSVPSDVTNELYRAGLIKDPLFGKNSKSIKYIFEKTWIYTCVFDSEEYRNKKDIRLVFEGLDTLSEIFLNGEKIGSTDNMFLKYEFSISGKLKDKDNILSVKFPSSTNYIKKMNDGTNYRSLFTQDRVYIRKAQCHWGWDWAPNLPGIGIYLPCYIEASDGVYIEDTRVITNLSGKTSFLVKLYNDGDIFFENKEGEYELEISVDGKTESIKVDGLKNLLNITIDNPKLWWPNGYGDANLYTYTVRLLKNKEEIQKTTGRFGIREIILREEPLEKDKLTFELIVNGRRIFAKGSNWVPISTMTGAIPDSSYEKLLHFAKDANMNMLRVWGGGFYEKDIFYDLCDELGILVWQDFMFSCSLIPSPIDGIEENFLKEAEYQITRLRNHPSIALWCGGNEYAPRVDKKWNEKGNFLIKTVLRGLCANLDEKRIYIHNSPCGILDDEWIWRTGDAHTSSLDDITRDNKPYYREAIAKNKVQFSSEVGLLSPTRLRSIKNFIPENEIESLGDTWEFHFLENPYALKRESCLKKEIRFADTLFGKHEDTADFLKKGMIVTSEVMKSEISFARSNKSCAGFMNWMFNDIWGCGTWSLIDYYFERKPVYYSMKRSYAPISLFINQEETGISISIVNDTEKEIKGCLALSSKKLNGETIESKTMDVNCAPFDSVSFPMDLTSSDYYSAKLESDGLTYSDTFFPHYFNNVKFDGKINYTIEEKEENDKYVYQVNIKSSGYSKAVFVDYKDNKNITYSDNFFDMQDKEERTIYVYSNEKLDESSITVKTFADRWED